MSQHASRGAQGNARPSSIPDRKDHMESIRIENNSVSCFVRSYLCAEVNNELQVFWLELAPYHPKAVGAIWASLVNNTKERLTIQRAAGLSDQAGRTTEDKFVSRKLP